jgi:hypothetical protein
MVLSRRRRLVLPRSRGSACASYERVQRLHQGGWGTEEGPRDGDLARIVLFGRHV